MVKLPTKRSITSLPRLVGSLFWASLWLVALTLGSLFLLKWFSADYFYPVRIIAYFLPWLLALLFPALVIAALARRKWLVATLAGPTIVIVATFVPLFWPRPVLAGPNQGLSLKIVSHNMFNQPDAAGLIKLIRQEQPDILLLQEFNPVLASMSLAALADLYPTLSFTVVDPSQAGFSAAVLSRYPVVWSEASFALGRTQRVRLATPAGLIEVWNVHPFPPYLHAPAKHDRHLQTLAEALPDATYPLIVAGDFNITTESANYTRFARQLHNAHLVAGRGFGFTFPVPPHRKGLPFTPGLLYRIDHILYDDHFVARQAETLPPQAGSDHLPIMAELLLLPSMR
jgi:endonuclease/exonuclease/phosphatase (EEP) superfamily protein YafD